MSDMRDGLPQVSANGDGSTNTTPSSDSATASGWDAPSQFSSSGGDGWGWRAGD